MFALPWNRYVHTILYTQHYYPLDIEMKFRRHFGVVIHINDDDNVDEDDDDNGKKIDPKND